MALGRGLAQKQIKREKIKIYVLFYWIFYKLNPDKEKDIAKWRKWESAWRLIFSANPITELVMPGSVQPKR